MRKVLAMCGIPPDRARLFSRHTFKRTFGNWMDVGGLSEPVRNILLHHKPGSGGSKMARTYTESELLEPVRLARKVLTRIRSGKLEMDKITETNVVLRPASSSVDAFALTIMDMSRASEPDSSGSDTSDDGESSDTRQSAERDQSTSPQAPEKCVDPTPKKRQKTKLLPSPPGGEEKQWQDPHMPPEKADPPAAPPRLGDTAWAVGLAQYKEQKGVYHASIAIDFLCEGNKFWEHGLHWRTICPSRLSRARVLLTEPIGPDWKKCYKCM